MQKVSNEYKTSMKEALRERSFMMVSFGLFHQEAQTHAKVTAGNFSYYSNNDIFVKKKDQYSYATLEGDYTRVDGSMLFLPRAREGNVFYDTGSVGKDVIGRIGYVVEIDLDMEPDDIKGLTIDFGEIYPVEFDIDSGNGKVYHVSDNRKSVYTTQEVFENTNHFKFTFTKMVNDNCRLRILSIQFGYGLVYYNEDIYDSSLESYVSPICESVPQFDFSISLKNIDRYFDIDNPDSAINFLETGQETEIYYGYQLPKTKAIEWIKGAKLLCCEWESDDSTATIRCQDIYRNMDGEFYKGIYRSDGITYYDLAVMVFEDAGITEYYIDPYLKKLTTRNPLPRVKHKEALQIIANACRCVLTLDRNGRPQIESSFEPEYIISCNGEAQYSKLQNIRNGGDKQEYAEMMVDYVTVDSEMYYLPDDTKNATLFTGYVSKQISDENGYFAENPVITVTQESACMYYGVKLTFGHALPAEIVIRTYNNGLPVEVYEITSDITKNFIVHNTFSDFDVMKIEFTKTERPHSRIVLNYFSFGDITDFAMERSDMTSAPKAIKQELVKEVKVPFYSYQAGNDEQILISEKISVSSGEIETFYLNEAVHGVSAKFGGKAENVKIVSAGNYYVTVQYLTTGTDTLEISGFKYNIVIRYISERLNHRGKTVTWQNPLIGDADSAEKLAKWLGEYYGAEVEYEYDTRGNPEIDVGDVIYQDNSYYPKMKVNLYRSTLNFNGSLSGSVTTRRKSLIYAGPYTITPSNEDQVLKTAKMDMDGDITVLPVPIKEKRNESGSTVIIG